MRGSTGVERQWFVFSQLLDVGILHHFLKGVIIGIGSIDGLAVVHDGIEEPGGGAYLMKAASRAAPLSAPTAIGSVQSPHAG